MVCLQALQANIKQDTHKKVKVESSRSESMRGAQVTHVVCSKPRERINKEISRKDASRLSSLLEAGGITFF